MSGKPSPQASSCLDQFAIWFGLTISIGALICGFGLSTCLTAAFINDRFLIPNHLDRYMPDHDDWIFAGIPVGGFVAILLAIRFHHRLWLHSLAVVSAVFVALVFVWLVNLRGFLAESKIKALVPPFLVMIALSAVSGAVVAGGIATYRKLAGKKLTLS